MSDDVSAPAEPVPLPFCIANWKNRRKALLRQILYLLKVHSAINISHLPYLEQESLLTAVCVSSLYQTRSFLRKSTLSHWTTLNHSSQSTQHSLLLVQEATWSHTWNTAACDFASSEMGQSRFNDYTQRGLAIQFTEHVNLHYTYLQCSN
jgi:hypothetical protein